MQCRVLSILCREEFCQYYAVLSFVNIMPRVLLILCSVDFCQYAESFVKIMQCRVLSILCVAVCYTGIITVSTGKWNKRLDPEDSIIFFTPVWKRSLIIISPLAGGVQYFVRRISPTRMEEFSWNFIQMFTTMWSCAAHMNQISRSKVKVTLRGHWITLARSKTSTCIEGFQYNLAKMFTILRRSVVCKI
jgi:hypothetical protein